MTDRDELIEIAWQAWLKAEDIHGGVVAVIDAVEQPIRADERENEKKRYLTAQAETGQMVSTLSYDLSEARLFIKNLRARVEALPPVPPNGSVLGHRFSDDRLIWRSEVIALLEEEDRD